MGALRTSLLLRVVVALILVGLLPFGIGLLQLTGQAKVLEGQAQSTSHLATRTAVLRVQAGADVLLGITRSTAEHPAFARGDRDAMAQALQGAVSSQPGVLGVGVYDLEGRSVLLAQRHDLEGEIGSVFGDPVTETPPPEIDLEWLASDAGPRLRIRRLLPSARGFVVLIADAASFAEMLDFPELGETFRMVLVDAEMNLLAGGDPATLRSFPKELVDLARADKVGSLSKNFRQAEGGLLAGYSRLELPAVSWFVLSRQSLAESEAAKERLRRVAAQGSLLALALTMLLAFGAFVTVVKPLRRLAAQQRELTGEAAPAGGSEIEQLERSFELLRERVKDRQDLGEIFLGRYQVTDLVGSGAMGSVFRGWDDKLQRAVALKTVHLDAEDVDRGKLLKSLREEAAITSRIHQNNIVTVYDIEDRGSSAFIAMEYVEGVNLQKLLQVRGHLTPQDAIPLAAGIARGLATAHANFLVHHDIKPANILLGLSGEVKLTDFGVSQSITAASQRRDVICGTPGYLPPECFEGMDYTPASDLWAFGVVLWEVIVGYNPFRGKSLRNTVSRTMTVDADPLISLIPETPRAFSDLVARLLEKEPEDRPAGGEEVAEQLEDLCQQLGLVWLPDLADVLGAAPGSGTDSTVKTRLLPTVSSQS
ncbi:MAG: serine/threonine-protein kinase [Acidobacteriota bacterium]